MNLLEELGINTLAQCSRDVYLLMLLRMIRLVAFGGTGLILALYLKALGLKGDYIGAFMTITFIGDLVSSFLLSMVADKLGRRKILIASSVAMAITGAVFAYATNPVILIIVAFLGVLTPSGGEVGPFRSIEQSSLASLTPAVARSDVFSWYNFSGAFCAALGSQLCGWMVDYLEDTYNFTSIKSFQAVWLVYGVIGVISIFMSALVSSGIEVDRPVVDEATPLIAEPVTKPWYLQLLPELHREILGIVVNLSFLFGIDAFASSLVPMSWQSFYIKQKFNIPASYLGTTFFVTGIVAACTSLLSTTITKRVGPVLTMVVTHLPSSILLGIIPFARTFALTFAILVVRASTQSMDVAPKHVFLTALVPDGDRTAVLGFVNLVKTLAQIPGPMVVGVLAKHNMQWITFCVASVLKVSYDLGVLISFTGVNHNHH